MFYAKKITLAVVFVFLILVGAACSSKPDQAAAGQSLVDTEWILQSLHGEPLIPHTNITLAFDVENIGGFAGCNEYGGPYGFGKKNTFQVEEIAQNLEGCIEPEGVLEQEDAYIQALLSVQAYRLESDRLELLDDAGNAMLIYERRVVAIMDPAVLEDTGWRLQTLGDQGLLPDSHITIYFSQGRMTGDAGCREYEGQYQAEGDHIVFPMLSMLGEVCGDEERLLQEMDFTEYLSQSTHYRVEGARLELFTATGEVVVFMKE